MLENNRADATAPAFQRRAADFAILALIAQLPFEFRYTLLGLTNLQWTFVGVVLLNGPCLLRSYKQLVSDRLVQTLAFFVAIQWLTAVFAAEFQVNAFKGAARLTAGLVLVGIARRHSESGGPGMSGWWNTWRITSVAAALYALFAYAGIGLPWLFRSGEFYIGQAQRLSGSFEYPNT